LKRSSALLASGSTASATLRALPTVGVQAREVDDVEERARRPTQWRAARADVDTARADQANDLGAR
jgi:hypothetical protein